MTIITKPRLSGSRNQCKACGEYFNSTTAFVEHRTGAYAPLARRCLRAAEMESAGMSRSAAGFWITETREQRLNRSRGRKDSSGLQPVAEQVPQCDVRPVESESAQP